MTAATKMITVAVRDMNTWALTMWVEESKGFLGWKRSKTFHNECICGCFLRCRKWKEAGMWCQPCYDICSVALAHPGNYNHPVLLTDLRHL